ncbi:3'-5' exonuclease [Alteromonas lipolytica]|uniref:Exonuclease domain-containing protein n=1 Tax=Alteromonas lipolytica TaxID=1856405 RepID=A0A1E8FD20_9ALTE|nr:hypothetical protein [Alteromonas lipolytica]OFI33824.1 hypothetical protein BFC17_19845 [Alteromonas lipolytica]GGF68054.1 hypothetical protein GCM10011338_20340 [Alteromonas lipolytica]
MQIPTIIDVEASGFGSYSYPIEVGVSRRDGARFCRLIRPYPDWTHWDDNAQKLHGITREHLRQRGVDGHEVCLALNEFLANDTAYSDGWVVDHPWLIRLFARAGVTMAFSVRALEYVLSEAQMELWNSTKNNVLSQFNGHRHRASTDAEIIQQTYIRTHASNNPAVPIQAVING